MVAEVGSEKDKQSALRYTTALHINICTEYMHIMLQEDNT